MAEKFWMVYGGYGGAPTYKHSTKAGAIAEAKRLCDQRSNATFTVLEAVTEVRPVERHTVEEISDTNDMPY